MRRPVAGHRRAGFTLIELLVVVGIIAVLLGILLPSLRRMKEHATQLVCLNNLRLISLAFLSYTQANQDMFPRPAVEPLYEDWIYWYPGRDLNQSRIAPYLGNRFDPNVFRCPAADANAHLHQSPLYAFSYTANGNILAYDRAWNADPSHTYPRDSINRNQIRDPTRCALVVEESDQTIDDGCWTWQGGIGGGISGAGQNVTSIRHDRSSIGEENVTDPTAATNGRTNVGFCDGHAEFIPRSEALQRPFWDPKYAP